MPTYNKTDMLNCCRGWHDFSDDATECRVCGADEGEASSPPKAEGDTVSKLLAALILAEKHMGALCADVAETDLPDWFADLATIREAITAAGGTVADTGGDHTKSTFFEMLDIHRDSVEILDVVLGEREEERGEDEVLRDLIRRIEAVVNKLNGLVT